MNTHICIPIEKALDLLEKGQNIFTGTATEAYNDLIQAQSEGKKFYSGCDRMNSEGRCSGHESLD